MEMGEMIVDGVRLEIGRLGPAQGPQIVLLHEGLGCAALWRDVPQRLLQATGLGVFAYSRQGYGASDPIPLPRPLDYMTREAVQNLPNVLDAVGISDAVLVGHSDGATIAAEYLGRVPGQVARGAILIAPHFFTEPDQLIAIADARVAFESGTLRDKLSRYHQDVDGTFWGWNRAWLDPMFKDWNVANMLDHINVPLLCVQGRLDPYGSLRQIEVVQERSQAPVEVVILDDVRHAPHLEAADTFDALCHRWVTELLSDFQ